MVDKKKLVITVLVMLCLTASLFTTISLRSQTPDLEYDPWVDLNDDGIIDIFDLVKIAAIFGTEGNPINKTALLLELQARVHSLNASLVELQSRTDIDKITTILVVVKWKNASVFYVEFNGLSISDVYNHTGGWIYKTGIMGPGEHTWLKVFIPGEMVRMDVFLETQMAEPPWYGNVTMYKEDGTLIGEYVTAYPNHSSTFFIDASNFF